MFSGSDWLELCCIPTDTPVCSGSVLASYFMHNKSLIQVSVFILHFLQQPIRDEITEQKSNKSQSSVRDKTWKNQVLVEPYSLVPSASRCWSCNQQICFCTEQAESLTQQLLCPILSVKISYISSCGKWSYKLLLLSAYLFRNWRYRVGNKSHSEFTLNTKLLIAGGHLV